jgi:hypothetical protein
MNTRTLIPAMALAAAAPAAVLAGETPASAPAATTASTVKPAKAADCSIQTGSRVRSNGKPICSTGAAQRSYSQKELQMTGETNIADALRRLDPIFR